MFSFKEFIAWSDDISAFFMNWFCQAGLTLCSRKNTCLNFPSSNCHWLWTNNAILDLSHIENVLKTSNIMWHGYTRLGFAMLASSMSSRSGWRTSVQVWSLTTCWLPSSGSRSAFLWCSGSSKIQAAGRRGTRWWNRGGDDNTLLAAGNLFKPKKF